jgi:hypothetical protein
MQPNNWYSIRGFHNPTWWNRNSPAPAPAPAPAPPPPPPSPTTILRYNTAQPTNPFTWGGVTFTLDTNLPSHSYTATTTSIPSSTVPNPTQLTQVTIGSTVASIGLNAFDGCIQLATVTFTGTSALLYIGISAFAGCTALTTIAIPASVGDIGYGAFSYSGLASVTFTSGLQRILTYAFQGCTSLTSIAIPASVTYIGNNAFDACIQLATVTLPTNPLFTSIGDNAFNGCIKLATIAIPASVTSIGDNAFNGCTSLTSIAIPASVANIGSTAFTSSGLATVTIADNQNISGITINSPDTGVSFFGAFNVNTIT